jgi:hypothetical protein
VFAGFMQLPLPFILILPGLMGRGIFPEIENRREVTCTFDLWHEESRDLAEKPWYMSCRFMAAAILVVTVAMVVYFI